MPSFHHSQDLANPDTFARRLTKSILHNLRPTWYLHSCRLAYEWSYLERHLENPHIVNISEDTSRLASRRSLELLEILLEFFSMQPKPTDVVRLAIRLH